MIEQFKYMIMWQMLHLQKQTDKQILFIPEKIDFVVETENNYSSIFSKTTYPLLQHGQAPEFTPISFSILEKSKTNDYISTSIAEYLSNEGKAIFQQHSVALLDKYDDFTKNYESFTKNYDIFTKNNTKTTKNYDIFTKNNNSKTKNNEDVTNNNTKNSRKKEKDLLKISKSGKILSIHYDKDIYLYNVPIERQANRFKNDFYTLIFNIELELNQVLKNNKGQKNKPEVEKYYNEAIFLAENQELAKLTEKYTDIETWKKNQEKGITTANAIQNKKNNAALIRKIKRYVLLTFISIAIIVVSILYFNYKYKKNKTTTPPSASEHRLGVTNNSFSKNEIIEFIESYENKNKCVIYPYRRDIIIDSIFNKNINKQRAFEIIDSCYLSIQ